MSAPLKAYQVVLTSWSAHSVLIQAASATRAEALAAQLWAENCDAFSHKDGGIDGISAEEVLP